MKTGSIREVTKGKKEYLPLLLEADPSEEMIGRYLEDGELLVWEENGRPVCVAVVLPLGDRECELKNLAVAEEARGRGYGRAMVEALFGRYRGKYGVMRVGTGDIPAGCKGFYEKLGFCYTHTVKGFFTDHYEGPIFDNGRLVEDMAYFRRDL